MVFVTSELEKEANDFSQLQIHPKHREYVEMVANVIEQYLEINHLALMGFAWKAIKEWQIKHKMTALEASYKDKEFRDQATKEMFDITKGYLKRVLRNKADEPIIDLAIDKAYQFYLNNIS